MVPGPLHVAPHHAQILCLAALIHQRVHVLGKDGGIDTLLHTCLIGQDAASAHLAEYVVGTLLGLVEIAHIARQLVEQAAGTDVGTLIVEVILELRTASVDAVGHAAVLHQRLVGPGIYLPGLLQIPLLGLLGRAISSGNGTSLGHVAVQQTGGYHRGEVDAGRAEVALLVWLGLVNGLPLPEHASAQATRRVGIGAVIAYAGRSIPHAAETALAVGEVLAA